MKVTSAVCALPHRKIESRELGCRCDSKQFVFYSHCAVADEKKHLGFMVSLTIV